MKRAFLTGATGFVGSAVARILIDKGWSVRALVRAGADMRNIRSLALEKIKGDLGDEDFLAQAMRGCHALFHVAADYRLWALDRGDIYRTNVGGSARIMRAALRSRIARIVYTSSIATLGTHPGGIADETTPVSFADMIGDYKKSKYLAEQEVVRMIREDQLPAIIVHPSMPVGPRDHRPTASGRLILTAARGAMPFYTASTGLNIAHVDDVAKGHWQAYAKGTIGQHYILGGENLSLGDLVRNIAAIAGKRRPIGAVPAAMVLPIAYLSEAFARLRGRDREPLITVTGTKLARKKMFFSSAKAQREIGYRCRESRLALTDAIDWFRTHGYC